MKSCYSDSYGGWKDLINALLNNHPPGIWVGGGPCWAEVWQTLDGSQWGRCLYVSETSPSAVSDQTYHRSREEVTHPLASRYFMAWAQITFLFDILECVPFAFRGHCCQMNIGMSIQIRKWLPLTYFQTENFFMGNSFLIVMQLHQGLFNHLSRHFVIYKIKVHMKMLNV